MRSPHFYQICGTFQYNNSKYHKFERNSFVVYYVNCEQNSFFEKDNTYICLFHGSFILPAFKNKIMLKDILLWFLSIVFVQIVSLQSFSVKVVLWLWVVIKFVTVNDKILAGSAVFVVTTKNKIFITGQSFLNLSPFSEQFSFFSQLCGQFNL